MKINYLDQSVIKGEKSIFLAGPTSRSKNITSWRKEACKKLEEYGFDGVVYVPEYSTGNSQEDYTDQVMWEREAMSEATTILFWIPKDLQDMPAFTTNVEFGYWLYTGKVIYGRPDNAKKVKYLDWLYKLDYNEKPFNDIDKLLKNGINKVNIKSKVLVKK